MPVDSPAAVDAPFARPRFIGESGRPLFTWHHVPPPHLRRGAGIVLCPPLAHEYMSAYRSFRVLAERLAAAGFDALRIDYDGTGNSAGDHEDPDRVGAWIHSITCAIAETRKLSHSNMVAIVGLGAGALLALRAAATTGGVTRLVLWNCFPSGRACVRELKAFARLSLQDQADEDSEGSAINVAGHVLRGETVEALASWTLEAITTCPAPDVLLVDRDDRSVDPTLETSLRNLGSHVDRIRLGGTAEMLAPPEVAKVPAQTLDQIMTWFGDWRAASPRTLEQPGTAPSADATIALGDGYRERTVRFGPDDRLFGVLASPLDDTSTAPAIILLSTGVEHTVGPQRLYVPLARRWAARGHVVLRFDLGGIGDSAPPHGGNENICYPGHMLADAREAIAFVRSEAPRRRVIAAGLCSGGWLAFRAAREGLAVDAIVCINPPLYLRDGAAGVRWVTEGRELERYQQSMRDPAKWVKALSGSASYATFTRTAASALARHVALRVSSVLGETLHSGLAKDLCAIADRGIKTLFVFSRGDDGLGFFQLHAQPALRRARVRDAVQHVVVEGAGHSFRPRAAQQTLRELLVDFVAAQT
jgi:alpha-beta hydrolase superfamily lysophospholipase